MSLITYPLVNGPNMDQLEREILLGEDVDPAEYSTPAFSPEFLAKYGNVVAWPRAWIRLMSAVSPKELIPRYQGKFLFVADNISFTDFCTSDLKAAQYNMPVLDRRQLEGAWVQELVFKYDSMTEEDLETVVGRKHINSVADALSLMQQRLSTAVAKRFTSLGIEEYWTEKGNTFPGLDIEHISDKAEEPEDELAEPDYDDENEDEEMQDVYDDEDDNMEVEDARNMMGNLQLTSQR